MRRFLLPLAFAIPALIGTGAQASEDLAWSYEPWVTQNLLAQAEGDEAASEEEKDDNDWRVYLDLYGFLPHENEGTLKLDGNTNKGNLSLSDILENVSSIATFRAGVERGRWGLQTGIFHGAVDFNDSGSKYVTRERSRIRELTAKSQRPRIQELTGNEVKRKLTIKGDVEGDFHLDQTLVDLAVRYRAGDVQRPKMDPGSLSFVGFAGARLVDGTIKTNVDIELNASYEGPILKAKRSKKLNFSDSWSHTWVQPLIGMHATYAFSPEWQAFVYADAAGFGLAGEKDLSGNAQAGIAYAVGNSTQISLSYKVFGLEYSAYGNDNGYKTFSHGPNIGIRFLFE